jgi:hypothetical protein
MAFVHRNMVHMNRMQGTVQEPALQAVRRNSGSICRFSNRFINAASCSDNLTHSVQLQT